MTQAIPTDNLPPLSVVFTGGGTGGHLYPALALASRLREISPDSRLLFIGSGRLEAQKVPAAGFPFKTISVRGLAGSWTPRQTLRKLHSAALLGLGIPFWQSLFHLLRFKPDVVIGTGGYVCGPVILAARLLKIPSISVEQNLRPGLTTRALARLVDVAALVSPDSIEHYPKPTGLLARRGKPKLVVTGNPVRPEFFAAAQNKDTARTAFGLAPDRLTLLVYGGSLGSAIINRTFLAVLDSLSKEHWFRTGLQTVHVVGRQAADTTELDELATRTRLRYQAHPYLDNLPLALAAADLAVCRGGGTTIAELAAAGLPAVIVPWAGAANNEQYFNARPLAHAGGAVIIQEDEFTPGRLESVLKNLLKDPARLSQMSTAAQSLARPHAADELLALAAKLAQEKQNRKKNRPANSK